MEKNGVSPQKLTQISSLLFNDTFRCDKRFLRIIDTGDVFGTVAMTPKSFQINYLKYLHPQKPTSKLENVPNPETLITIQDTSSWLFQWKLDDLRRQCTWFTSRNLAYFGRRWRAWFVKVAFEGLASECARRQVVLLLNATGSTSRCLISSCGLFRCNNRTVLSPRDIKIH